MATRRIRKSAKKVASIDAYLAGIDGSKRGALDRLRKTIRSILPRAEECLSYGLPAFRVDGRVVAGFAATAQGCSYYPFSSLTLVTLAGDVKAYATSKGALQFAPEKPLPVALVRKLIKARLAEEH